MIDNHLKNGNGNLYIASLVAILFVLAAAIAVWMTQIRPSTVAQVSLEMAPAEVAPTPAQAQEAVAQSTLGDPAAGQASFTSCTACHGPAGQGIVGLGKDLTISEFVTGKTDQELVEFIKVGRDPSDPLNTTGIAMPPKGGNPALDDEDLQNIIAYIRTLHQK